MTLGVLISRIWRFLTFRGLKVESAEQLNIFLIVGIMFTWVAGIGRYWDHPSADIWQYAGLGSVAYIFILALIIWAIVILSVKDPGVINRF